jgi:hypothetical protein
MFKLSASTLLAGLAIALPAQAQFAIPSSAITLNYTNNNG